MLIIRSISFLTVVLQTPVPVKVTAFSQSEHWDFSPIHETPEAGRHTVRDRCPLLPFQGCSVSQEDTGSRESEAGAARDHRPHEALFTFLFHHPNSPFSSHLARLCHPGTTDLITTATIPWPRPPSAPLLAATPFATPAVPPLKNTVTTTTTNRTPSTKPTALSTTPVHPHSQYCPQQCHQRHPQAPRAPPSTPPEPSKLPSPALPRLRGRGRACPPRELCSALAGMLPSQPYSPHVSH